jgi:tape measure domain-containing protein
MAANVGTLLIELGADVARLRTDLGKAHQEAQNAARRISRAFDMVGVSLAGAFSMAGITAAAKATFNAAVEAERLAKAYGTIEGSAAGARQQLAFLRAESDRLGMNFQESATAAKTFFASGKGTALEGDMRRIFSAVSEAGTALSLSQDEMNGIFLALGQMISKGKVQAEELRGQLGERLPGAFGLAAKAMGVTTGELDKMLESGKVLAEDMLPKLADAMHAKFGKPAMEAAKGGAQEVNRMASEWESFKANVIDSGPMIAAIKAVTDALKSGNSQLVQRQMHSKGMPDGQYSAIGDSYDVTFTDAQIQAFKEYGTIVTEEINRIERAKQEANRNDYTAQALEKAIGKASAATKDYLKGSDAEKAKKIRDEAQEAIAAQIKARELDVENADRYTQRIASIERERNRQLAEVGKAKREELKKQEQDEVRFISKLRQDQAERHQKAKEGQYDAENETKLSAMAEARTVGGADIEDRKAQLRALYEVAALYTTDRAALEQQLHYKLLALDLERLKSSRKAADGMSAALQTYAEEAGNKGRNAFDLWTTSIKGTEDALTNMLSKGEFGVTALFDTIRSEVIRTQMVRPLLSGATSWLSGLNLSSMFSNIFHDGGIVGQTSGPGRMVSPALFAGAPRFHNGLMPDEFPAILQRGEAVIPRDQVGAMGQGGGSTGRVTVQLVNKSGQQLKASTAKVSQDSQGMIVEVILDAWSRDVGGMRTTMQGGR